MKKYLVCGNAPCLIEQLKGRDLSTFTVVRINNWKPIEGYDNKCDVWVCYPLSHIGEKEGTFDFKPYLDANPPEVWVPHIWTRDVALRVLQREFVMLRAVPFQSIQAEFAPNAPTTGVLAVYMAMMLSNFVEPVYIAGYDYYEGERDHYFEDKKAEKQACHDPKKDKAWMHQQIREGRVVVL
jgi:hypothetical protein